MSVACIFVAIIVSQAIAEGIASDKLVENAKENLATLAATKADSLEQYIAAQKTLVDSVANNGDVIDACQNYDQTGEFDTGLQESLAVYLGQIQSDASNLYENFFVTVGSAGFADCLKNSTLHDVAEEPFYKECLNQKMFFGTNVSPVTGNPVYVIAYAVTDPVTGKVIGSVNSSIDLATMTAQLIADDTYDIKLLTLEGLVIASQDESEILKVNISESNSESWGTITSDKQGVTDYIESGKTVYTGFSMSDNFVTEISIGDELFDAAKQSLRNATIWITIVAILIAAVVTALLSLSIVRPLKKANITIKQLVSDIQNGNGDLTTRIAVKSADEVGEISESMNQFIQTLQGIMALMGNSSNKLSTISSSIKNNIVSTEDQISNVSATMQEMSAASQETSASLTQVVGQTDTIVGLIDQVHNDALERSNATREIVTKVADVREQTLLEREESDSQTSEMVTTLQASMESAKEVDKITDLTEDILNIAKQTNLLALNASIEAARAGDAGKGFAVVADEIRQLADSSRETANNIQTISTGVIASVNDLSEKAQLMANTLMESNDGSRKLVEELTTSYQNDIQNMAKSMDGFAEKSSEVQSSMQYIKTSIDAINTAVQETAEGVTSVTEATVDIAGNITNITTEAEDNLHVAAMIQEEVSKFDYGEVQEDEPQEEERQ